jgi:DNA polymerase III delta prime subunit
MSNKIQHKYTPQHLNNIIGNKETIKYIKNWLETYEDVKNFLKSKGLLKKSSKGRKKKLIDITDEEIEYSKRRGNLLVSGMHGCGKSTIISLILKEYNYDIINLNTLDLKTKIDVELMSKFEMNYKLEDNKKPILLIDELESVITLNDKNGVFNIIKENNFKRWMPIIIITNNQHNKQLTEAKKFSNEVKIYSPYQSEIVRWVSLICNNENINMGIQVINKFVEYCQNDMRKLLIQLDELKINYGSKTITIELLNSFMDIMKEKDLDFDLYKATNKILTDYRGIDSCLELYETEKVLMPLMIFENYHKFIKKEASSRILNNLSIGDILENYIYGEQNWDLLELHGMISCCIPSHLITKYSNGIKNAKLEFAIDLNRTSVKKMNKKNIIKTNNSLNKNNYKNIRNKSIDEFIYMGEIMNKINEESKISSDQNYINIIKINKLKSNPKSSSKKKI